MTRTSFPHIEIFVAFDFFLLARGVCILYALKVKIFSLYFYENRKMVEKLTDEVSWPEKIAKLLFLDFNRTCYHQYEVISQGLG